jgi:cytochrome c-type biogenesis protein CcmE
MRVGTKLVLGAVVMSAAIAYVAYLGAAGSWQYYLLVDECASHPEQWKGRRLRVNGRVMAGTLNISADRRAASLLLAGTSRNLLVHYQGVLPDNLSEGKDVVIEGSLREDCTIHATTIITRCASKYAPAGTPKAPESGAADKSDDSISPSNVR